MNTAHVCKKRKRKRFERKHTKGSPHKKHDDSHRKVNKIAQYRENVNKMEGIEF